MAEADKKPEKATDDKELWDALRKPFPPEVIGQLPRGGRSLDFVGHAAVTDRLNNTVGPDKWDLLPLSFADDGSPVITKRGNKYVMWATLTVLGSSKICVGTVDGNKDELEKELIGDALRNGAMRFGIALDLWTKDELESTLADPSLKNDKPSARGSKSSAKSTGSQKNPAAGQQKAPASNLEGPATEGQLSNIRKVLSHLGVDPENMSATLTMEYGVEDPKNMTVGEAKALIDKLMSGLKAAKQEGS